MARNTQVYAVTTGNEVQEVTTLKAVKELLGNTAITTKGIMNGEYPEVSLVEETTGVLTLADVAEAGLIEVIHVGDAPKPALTKEAVMITKNLESRMEDLSGSEDGHEEWASLEDLVEAIKEAGEVTPELQETYLALTNIEEESTVDPEPIDNPDEADKVAEPSDKSYPEVGDLKDEKAIKKYIKGLTDAELAEWVELEGLEYKPNAHESINRMRQAMAIKALHFPDTAPKAGSSKKKSKYSDYSTEQLVQMALDNEVEVRDDKGDMRILRMYTIMALKDAKLLG